MITKRNPILKNCSITFDLDTSIGFLWQHCCVAIRSSVVHEGSSVSSNICKTNFKQLSINILFVVFFSSASMICYGNESENYFFTGPAKCIEDTVIKNCAKSEQVEKIITDAIAIGAPVYNSGYHLECYRIYEWAGYKILYEYGKACKDVEKILKAAIDKSHGDYSDLEKAWIMRAAFDKIMGVPTQTVDPSKKTGIEKG